MFSGTSILHENLSSIPSGPSQFSNRTPQNGSVAVHGPDVISDVRRCLEEASNHRQDFKVRLNICIFFTLRLM
jgi:hypothetical protein